MEVNKEQIEQNVQSWTQFNLGTKFEFREGQKEAIVDVIYNILTNDFSGQNLNGCQVIEAPTGSGKSLINIISAGVLFEYYKKRSYILASDLTLWKQYYDFINNNRILKNIIGCIKGQTGNYTCIKNNEDLRNCECRMAGYTWAQLYNPVSAKNAGFDCAIRCKYLKERKKALKSPITLMTYQLFFYVIDIQNDDERVPVFDHRDVLFCDECHNIPNIVQMQYSPDIKPSDPEHLYKIYNYCANKQMTLFEDSNPLMDPEILKIYPTLDSLKSDWDKLWEEAKDYHTTIKEDYECLFAIHMFWNQFAETIENIENDFVNRIKLKLPISKEEREIYRECTYVENYLTAFRDITKTINIVGTKYLVKQINQNSLNKEEIEISSVCFHCAKEDYMVYEYLLRKSPYKVMVSATVGDKDDFADNIGIKYYGMQIEKPIDYDLQYNYLVSEEPLHDINELDIDHDEELDYWRIPSTFNFDKSPIHFLNRYKMSFSDREHSLENLKQIIYNICEDQFKDKKGMIQTGTYLNAKEIIDSAPEHIKSRLLYYNGSREKNTMLTKHQLSRNTILIGPTLCEGIDLPGDDCRFIIILKVPYPQIKDRLVDAKMKLFPKWYNSTTSNLIIQGIGRGNRYKDDWCVTYILDACFFSLYCNTKDQYAPELQKRIKIYN